MLRRERVIYRFAQADERNEMPSAFFVLVPWELIPIAIASGAALILAVVVLLCGARAMTP